MISSAPGWRLSLLLILILSGCSQFKRSSLEDEKDPHFIEGKKRVNALDWDGALRSFERALQSNPNNAAAHLELGIIFDQRKNDFIPAMYHYQKHLVLRTNSPMAEVVNQNLIACKRELAKTVSYAIVTREVHRDLERLANTNAVFKQRIEMLEAEIGRRPQYVTNHVTNFVAVPQFDPRSSARLTQPTQLVDPPVPEQTSAPPVVQARVEPSRPPQNQQRTAAQPTTRSGQSATRTEAIRTVHTVRPGETLASLARRYGVSMQALQAANPGAQRGVRAGQQIKIPAR
jgi:LysM repeat protein